MLALCSSVGKSDLHNSSTLLRDSNTSPASCVEPVRIWKKTTPSPPHCRQSRHGRVSRQCSARLPFLCCGWKSARGSLRLWRNQESQGPVKFFMQVNKSKVPRGDAWPLTLVEPRCRAAPFTPIQGVPAEGWMLFLNPAGSISWRLTAEFLRQGASWGTPLQENELGCARKKHIQQNTAGLGGVQSPAGRAGSTQRDDSRRALGGTGRSATFQWRPTSFSAPALGKGN